MKSSLSFHWAMPSPLRVLDPASLLRRRQEVGLSRGELAARVGVSPRMVAFYEDGTHAPSPVRLASIARALGCGMNTLVGTVRGQETLVDLRYAAGLTLQSAAQNLRRSEAGRGLAMSAPRLSVLESGRPMKGRGWDDPEKTGRLLAPLAKAYGVPVRMVLDAWMRTRTGEAAPVLKRQHHHSASPSVMAQWESLNERQQVYLGEIMRDDRMTETEMWMRRVQRLPIPPASKWRLIPLAVKADPRQVGYTRLQERLRRKGVHDPGAGQTVQALSRRGLIQVEEDSIAHPVVGEVERVLVVMTRRGRAVAREGLGEMTDPQPAEHLLSEWLWGVLVRVAAAEPTGLEDDRLAGRSLFFIGVGYSNKMGGHPSRGFIDSVPVMASDGSHVKEYRWRLTPLGREHVAEYLPTYQDLYPGVNTAALDDAPSDV